MKTEIKYADFDKFRKEIKKLSDNLRGKIIATLMELEECGIERIDTKYLRSKIYEIRIIQSNIHFRILFFYNIGTKSCIVIIGGFVKKTQKTPKHILKHAEKVYKNYLNRNEEKR